MGNNKATLKLYASLGKYLPAGAVDNKASIEVDSSSSLSSIIDGLNLPPRLVHLVLINGVYIEPQDRETRILAPGEVLAIWPPVAGG